MAANDYLDEVEVTFESGNGGNGAATFHREKHVPRGGPNGANGGRGGSIILVADRHKRSLYEFRFTKAFKAENGSSAIGSKTGKDGKDLRISVPVGTLVTDTSDNEVLADLSQEGMEYEICRGGRGGLGNLHYTNSVRQAPHFSQNGAPGDEVVAKLELKLIADVGLIGLPNAGKSTLLSSISAAQPKTADYPFTTLTPHLGVVSVGHSTITVSDLPGLIEGASEGKGLGHQFLRHAERNIVLLHVVDMHPMDGSDPRENFDLIEKELAHYSQELADRPRLIALNKADLGDEELSQLIKELFADIAAPLYVISGVSGQGLTELKFALLDVVERHRPVENPDILRPTFAKRADDRWDVAEADGTYIVSGARIDRLVSMTPIDNKEALHLMMRKLRRIGVLARLEELGVEEGDSVTMGGIEFEYRDW